MGKMSVELNLHRGIHRLRTIRAQKPHSGEKIPLTLFFQNPTSTSNPLVCFPKDCTQLCPDTRQPKTKTLHCTFCSWYGHVPDYQPMSCKQVVLKVKMWPSSAPFVPANEGKDVMAEALSVMLAQAVTLRIKASAGMAGA